MISPARSARLALVALALLLAPLPTSHAQVDTGELERLEREVERYRDLVETRDAEIARLDAALQGTEAEVSAALAQRDEIAAQLQRVRLERDATQAQLRELTARREATEAEIEVAQAELVTLRGRVQGLLQNLHRRRAPRFAQVFGRSESFHDLQVKNRFLGMLAEQDVALVSDLDALLGTLAALQRELSEQIAAQSAAEDELAEREARLAASRAELEAAVEQLNATLAGQRAQRRAELERQRELEAELGDLVSARTTEAERIARERELRAAAQARLDTRQREQQEALRRNDQARAEAEGGVSGGITTAGYFAPTRGRVTRTYAPGEGRSYIEFRAAETRAAVRAVDDGEVLTVRWTGANDGFLVVIDHGGGLMSIYLNLRPPLVEPGDPVRGGQLLGYLGGGTLIQEDTLRLYLSVEGTFVDPVPRLGF